MTSRVADSPVGQRLLVTLVNTLCRMKGVVRTVHVLGLGDDPVLPQVPLDAPTLAEGLGTLVMRLNSPMSDFRAEISFATPNSEPAARINLGGGDGLAVGADGWRALLGSYAADANWNASPPYGAALAAALAAAETYKRILIANGVDNRQIRLGDDLAYSLFNYGVGPDAVEGPAVSSLQLAGVAVAGCGAGGTAALYVLAMQPGLTGELSLIEPNVHKLSNVNRYLMTTAADVGEHRHKLGSATGHLAKFAPGVSINAYPRPWEQLDEHPWPIVVSAVDTVEARWSIQARSPAGAQILDGSVLGMLYNVVRVVPGGWCLECKHPYDPELSAKQRAARWGRNLQTIRDWAAADVSVDQAMIERLAETQNRPVEDFADLLGVPFSDTPRLLECGVTPMSTQVPSQAPVLPIATTPVGVVIAAELAKSFAAPDSVLSNWLAHDLQRAPGMPRVKWRPLSASCSRHE